MFSNTKLLIAASLLTIILGFSFLWFGFQPLSQPIPTPVPITTTLSRPEASQSAVFGIEGERAVVTKVVDGDTLEISTGQTVRFIGIDTPETVDPRRPVGCFGKEASNETKKLLTGKEVVLQKDVSDIDKYHRLLRYIYLPLEGGTTLFVNDYLVRQGYAKVYTYPPDIKFNEQFRQAEAEAREKNIGFWRVCR
ncbi:thermonuclease family protein [Candidatus Daviesbacteria bacterium]|nr:thermonuclease family protein [Candidatus Daviesbacteria bacterium]